MKPRLFVGDILSLPLVGDFKGIAQVIGTYQKAAFLVAVFDRSFVADSISIDEVLGSRVALLGLTFDARVGPGMWEVIGNRIVDPAMLVPEFLEQTIDPPRAEVVRFDGELRRPATPEDVARIKPRKVYSPMVVEEAARAHFGFRSAHEMFDGLKPANLSLVSR